MIKELIKAFSLIFIAEMGDKSQIIAMTFATKYRVRDVINGIILGVGLNHGIAIILGRFISKKVPLNIIQLIAGILFVIFGIMALKDEEVEESDDKQSYGPIISVALAFFIGELGDKTQLTAMTLSSEANYPLLIFMGTTLGMVATSGVGIFIGSRIGEKIPEFTVKIISSLVFISFGTFRIYNMLPSDYINILYIVLYLIVVLSIEFSLIYRLLSKRRESQTSQMKLVASKLLEQTKALKEALDRICVGEGKCGMCIGANCIIGYTRFILKQARETGEFYQHVNVDIDTLIKKDYDISKVINALSMIIVDTFKNNWSENKDFVVNKIKVSLESIIFGESLHSDESLQRYLDEAKSKNKKYGLLLEKEVYKFLNNQS